MRRIELHGIPLTHLQLASHHHAGGRITSLIDGVLYAREHGIKLAVGHAQALDLLAAVTTRDSLTERIRAFEAQGIRDLDTRPLAPSQQRRTLPADNCTPPDQAAMSPDPPALAPAPSVAPDGLWRTNRGTAASSGIPTRAWWKYESLFVIKWREPYGFTRHLRQQSEKNTLWWTRPLQGGVAAAIIYVLLESIAAGRNRAIPVGFGSVLLGFGGAYFLALVRFFESREVGLGEKAFVMISSQHTQGWPYKAMTKVSFIKQIIRGREFQVMTVALSGLRNLTVAIPEKLDRNRLIAFLQSKGVPTSEPD